MPQFCCVCVDSAIVISPVQELQVEVGSHQEDHSFGRSRGLGSSPVLVRSLSSGRGRPSGLTAVRSDTDNRRLQLRLGSSPRWQPLVGKVDCSGVKVPHKRSRDNGSHQSDPLLSGESSDQIYSGSDRQHCSSVLSESDGRDQVPASQPVSPGDHSLVSGQVDHNSSGSPVRGRQCRGRHSISPSFDSPTPTGQLSGVVSRLDQELANLIFYGWGSPVADLFATAANAKVLVFYSRTAEPLACQGDAF